LTQAPHGVPEEPKYSSNYSEQIAKEKAFQAKIEQLLDVVATNVYNQSCSPQIVGEAVVEHASIKSDIETITISTYTFFQAQTQVGKMVIVNTHDADGVITSSKVTCFH
jgi:hypothetical protein